MDPAKVEAVTNWLQPEDRKTLQRFLGFANFYRSFICNYSTVAAPLMALTSTKTRFVWNEKAEATFKTLKNLFTTAPILNHPDPEKVYCGGRCVQCRSGSRVVIEVGSGQKVSPVRLLLAPS